MERVSTRAGVTMLFALLSDFLLAPALLELVMRTNYGRTLAEKWSNQRPGPDRSDLDGQVEAESRAQRWLFERSPCTVPLPIPGRASLAGFRQMHAGAGEEAFNRLPSAPAAPPDLVERGERLELNGSSHAFPLC